MVKQPDELNIPNSPDTPDNSTPPPQEDCYNPHAALRVEVDRALIREELATIFNKGPLQRVLTRIALKTAKAPLPLAILNLFLEGNPVTRKAIMELIVADQEKRKITPTATFSSFRTTLRRRGIDILEVPGPLTTGKNKDDATYRLDLSQPKEKKERINPNFDKKGWEDWVDKFMHELTEGPIK